jgi:hypothetical protein
MIIKLRVLLFLTIVPLFNLYSQGIDCPEDYNPQEWSLPYWAKYSHDVRPPAVLCEVDYKLKNVNNNKTEIVIDWSTYGGSTTTTNLEPEDIKDFLYLSIVFDAARISPPWIGIKEFVIIEKSRCKLVTSCYYEVNQTSEIICGDEYWDPSEIEEFQYSYNNVTYWRIGKLIECGIKCCTRTIFVELVNNQPIITGMDFDEYPGTSCYPGTNILHCKGGNPQNCNANCDNSDLIRE